MIVKMDKTMLLTVLLWCSLCGPAELQEMQSSTTSSAQDQVRISYAISDFGYKLMTKMMEQNPDKNIIISPTSVAGLLSMTLLGSVGKAYDELAQALGFSQDILINRRNHEEFGELLQDLANSSSYSQTQTLYADAIIVDDHTQVREAYRGYLQRVYRGDVLTTSFGDSDKAKELINEWVKNHTMSKIENFLKDPLPTNTRIVLLSALYFIGQWVKPFNKEHTKQMFFKTPNKEVLTDLMLNFGKFNYTQSHKHGMQMIALPYNDSSTTMYIIKTHHSNSSLSSLVNQLNYSNINEFIEEMFESDCVIRFPKMELQNKVHLEEPLKALGITSLFNPREANFALMVDDSLVANRTEEEIITRVHRGEVETRDLKDTVNSLPNPGVYVDTVLHDVKISIDEFGTEAAAASSGFLPRTSHQFYVDSPFYMFIRNEQTKLVTFSAAIFDPTA